MRQFGYLSFRSQHCHSSLVAIQAKQWHVPSPSHLRRSISPHDIRLQATQRPSHQQPSDSQPNKPEKPQGMPHGLSDDTAAGPSAGDYLDSVGQPTNLVSSADVAQPMPSAFHAMPVHVITHVTSIASSTTMDVSRSQPSDAYIQRSPSQVASDFVAPFLREIEMFEDVLSEGEDAGVGAGDAPGSPQGHFGHVGPDTLERWRIAYAGMAQDAQALGIPRSAVPLLPPGASVTEIRDARDHLESMMASFLSSCL